MAMWTTSHDKMTAISGQNFFSQKSSPGSKVQRRIVDVGSTMYV